MNMRTMWFPAALVPLFIIRIRYRHTPTHIYMCVHTHCRILRRLQFVFFKSIILFDKHPRKAIQTARHYPYSTTWIIVLSLVNQSFYLEYFCSLFSDAVPQRVAINYSIMLYVLLYFKVEVVTKTNPFFSVFLLLHVRDPREESRTSFFKGYY